MVSRISIGGSAGFRMMMAFARVGSAQHLDRRGRRTGELVDVLPSPWTADLDATVATISAYDTDQPRDDGMDDRDRRLARHRSPC